MTSAVAPRSISSPRPDSRSTALAGRAISRVMIVDDNPEIHSLLAARLEARGFIVQSAANGEDALTQFKNFRPDIAFLDLTMPHLGGLDVLQVIRAQNMDMAVVLTAAMGMEQMAINAL